MGYRASTTLLITGEQLDPERVSQLLKLQASMLWRQGEPTTFVRKSGAVRLLGGREKTSGWKLLCPGEWKRLSIEKQLENWIDLLTPRKPAIRKLRMLGYQCALDVFVVRADNLVFALEPDICTRLGSLGLEMMFAALPP